MKQEIKDEFIKFLLKDYSIHEFEQIIYLNQNWENEIDIETFLEIISFDFKEKYAPELFSKFILENLIDEKEYLHHKIRKAFKNSGWYKERNIELEEHKSYNSKGYSKAKLILKEFGGLRLTKKSKIDGSDYEIIEFAKSPTLFEKWNPKIDPLYSIAWLSQGYVCLFVNDRDEYYTIDDVIFNMSYAGKEFENVMENILENKSQNDNLKPIPQKT